MNIYQAIHGVMNEVGAIGKDKKNQQHGFMYRGVDDVMNALQPAFVHNNIFVVPEVLEQTREERTTKSGGQLLYSILKVKFTFYADDGSFVSATVVGEGMDSADKSSNKAMSVAFKYACFQVFCIPTEEMVIPTAKRRSRLLAIALPQNPYNALITTIRSRNKKFERSSRNVNCSSNISCRARRTRSRKRISLHRNAIKQRVSRTYPTVSLENCTTGCKTR